MPEMAAATTIWRFEVNKFVNMIEQQWGGISAADAVRVNALPLPLLPVLLPLGGGPLRGDGGGGC